MPSSSDSLRSAGNNGLKGRIASVWPAAGSGFAQSRSQMTNKAIAAITAISTAAPAASSTDPSARGGGRCTDGAATLLAAVDDRLIAPRDLRDEAIALASDGRDVAILAARFAQHLTQGRDVLREAVLLDDHARPDRAQQHVLVERLARVLDEIDQRVEHLCREQGRLSRVPAQQALLADVQGEIAELVVARRCGSWAREVRIRTNHNFSATGQGFFHGSCAPQSRPKGSTGERADWETSMNPLHSCCSDTPYLYVAGKPPGLGRHAGDQRDTDRRCGGEPCAAVIRGLFAFFDRDLHGLDGNGRSCADCHMVTEQFRLTPAAAESQVPAAAKAASLQPQGRRSAVPADRRRRLPRQRRAGDATTATCARTA